MEEVDIIKLLQEGEFEKGCKEAIEILLDSSKGAVKSVSRSKFAARVLAVLNKQSQSITPENVQLVVDSALLCYDRLESQPIDWKHPLDLEKYMYNLTVNVAKQKYYKQVHILSKRLLEDFKLNYNKEPMSAKTMSYNLYYNLWDCANHLASDDLKFELVFHIRSIAVYFYLLHAGDILSCQEKVFITLEKVDSMFVKATKSVGMSKDFGSNVSNWCIAYSMSLLQPSTSSTSMQETEFVQRFSYAVEIACRMRKCLIRWLLQDEVGIFEKSIFKEIQHIVNAYDFGKECSVPSVLRTVLSGLNCMSDSKPSNVSLSALSMIENVNRMKNDTMVMYACTAVIGYLNHILFTYKSSQTRYSTSVGITMTAYGHMKWEELAAIEDIHFTLSQFYEVELKSLLFLEKGMERSASERNKLFKRIKQLVTNRVIAMSDSVYIKASRIYKQEKNQSELTDLPALIEQSDRQTKQISTILCDDLPLQPGVKLNYEEHVHCGFMLYKLGRVIGNRVSHYQSVQFFILGLKHYKLYHENAKTQEREKQQLHQRYDALVSAQRKSKQFEGAMRTACESVLLCPGHIDTVAEMWQVIKHDVNKQRGPEDKLVLRTLWQEIQHICVETGQKCSIHPEKVYAAELRACKDKDASPITGKCVLLDQYLHVARCPALKARLLIEKAQISWAKRDGNAVKLVQQAISLLEGSDKSLPTYWDDMAMAQVMYYVVQDVDVLEMENTREKKKQKDKEKEHQRPDSPLEGLEEAELYQNATTLGDEVKTVSSAVKALEYWKNIQKPSTKNFRDQLSSLDAMMLLSEVFKLLYMTSEEAQILEMVIPICKQDGGDEIKAAVLVHAVFSLSKLLNTNTQPHITITLIKETQEWIDTRKFEVDIKSRGYLSFLGIWSETLLMLNEVESGWSKLQQALEMKEKHIRSRTKEDLELEGYLRRLQSRFLSLPETHWPKGPPESKDWALEVIIRGARSIGGVICSLLGPSFINIADGGVKSNNIVLDNVMDKWYLLEQLLDMFHETGTIFLQLGDARDAKCYLQQGLLITQTMKLPRRLAYFHLLMARLDNICGKFQDSRAHLHTVAYILNSKTIHKNSATSSRSNSTKKAKKVSFGDYSPGKDTKATGDNEFEIKSQTIEFEDHLSEFIQERPVEQAASPKHQKEQFEVPEFWSHDSDCKCELCTDIETMRLGLMYVLCYSELYIMEGKHHLGKQYLSMLLQKADHYTSKSLKILDGIISPNVVKSTTEKSRKDKSKRKNKDAGDDANELIKVKSCTFQNVIIEGCKLMVYMALIDLDLKEHQEWTKRMQSLLKLECYPWTVTAWIDTAEAHHLGVTPSLPWPPGEPASMDMFDVLCKEVEGLSLNTDEIRNCATPVALAGGAKMRSRLGVSKAPVKKKRGMFGSAYDTPEVLSKNSSSKNSPLEEMSSSENSILFDPSRKEKEARKKSTKSENSRSKKHNYRSEHGVNKVALPTPNLPENKQNVIQEGAYTKFKAEVHCNKASSAKPKMKNSLDSKLSPEKETIVLKSRKPRVPSGNKVEKDVEPSSKQVQKKRTKSSKGPSANVPLKTILKSNVFGAEFLESPDQKFKIFTENINFKKGLKPMTDEEIYDFISSSPDITPLTRKKTGKKTTTARKADAVTKSRKTSGSSSVKKGASNSSIEHSRTGKCELLNSQIFDSVCSLSVNCNPEKLNTFDSDSSNVIKSTARKKSGNKRTSGSPNSESNVNNRRVRKTNADRVTRSKTVMEEQRYDSECESDELIPEIDVSGVVVVSDYYPSSPDNNGNNTSLGDSPMIERKAYDSLVDSPLLNAKELEARNIVSPAVLPPDIEFSPVETVRNSNGHVVPVTKIDDIINVEPSLDSRMKRNKEVIIGECDDGIELLRGGDSDSDRENKPPKRRGLQGAATSKSQAETGVELPRKTVIKQRTKGSSQGVRADTLATKMDKLALTSPHKGVTASGSEIKQHLLHAFNLLKGHPPSVPYRNVCHALATLEINQGNELGAVFYMTEAQSVIFRHNALMNISKKIRKLSTMTKGLSNVNEQTVKHRLYEVGDVLAFNKTEGQINTAIQNLPTGWTVCHVSVIKSPSQESGEMFVTHMTQGQPLLLHRLPGFSTAKGQKILVEFDELMRENSISMHITVRQEWWSRRRALDIKFGELLNDVVAVWLAGWKCLLLGLPCGEMESKQLQTAVDNFCNKFQKETFTEQKRGLVKIIMNGCHLLQDREILQMLCELSSNRDPIYLHSLSKEMRSKNEGLNSKTIERQPVILILDRLVQHLPWECLSFMQSQPVSRVPNLYFLQSLLQQQMSDPNSLYNTGIDPHDTYYILDPESNLTYTQDIFKEWFKKQEGWNGIVGKVPCLEEYKTALTRDLFLYCGHGGGNRFLSGDIIQTMQCRSCALIMGCSSGKLTVLGHLEASGLTLNYFLAGSPCLIGNLWDVTDKDIDRFTEELLKTWLNAKDGTSITEPFAKSRQTCRLPNLIGAAPVMYGIPLKIKNKSKKQ